MKLKLSEFSACGFPEETLFWFITVSGLIFIFSFATLHFCVNEKYKKYGFFPVVFLLFAKDAFNSRGKGVRWVFLVSGLLCFVSFIALKHGLESGYFTCGSLSNG